MNITGTSVDVQFVQSLPWIMVGEVSFDGTYGAAVPEPATWELMAGGLAFALFRRRLSF